MGICQHVNYYRVLGNLLLIALTSVVLRYSTPILPFFILEAKPFIFWNLVLYGAYPVTPVHGFGATCKGTSQNLSTLLQQRHRRRYGFIYSTNIYDKIRPIRVLPAAFFSIVIQCPFHTGREKLLECVSCSLKALINFMNRELEYEINHGFNIIDFMHPAVTEPMECSLPQFKFLASIICI